MAELNAPIKLLKIYRRIEINDFQNIYIKSIRQFLCITSCNRIKNKMFTNISNNFSGHFFTVALQLVISKSVDDFGEILK